MSEVDTDEEGAPLPPYVDFDLLDARIEERRLDPYLMMVGTAGALSWETGLRYESTEVEVSTLGGDRVENDFGELLPSAHLRWDLTEASRLTGSLARTVRRPNFNFLNPTELEGEYGDNDLIGNPLLEPETAWGVDFGFEHRLGRQGVVGVNLFYRDVSDLIEIVNTGWAPVHAFCEAEGMPCLFPNTDAPGPAPAASIYLWPGVALEGRLAARHLLDRPAPPRRLVPAKTAPEYADKTSLLDLSDKICKWPLGHPGEPDFHFCGEKVNPGFPYCVQHCGHAYQAQMPSAIAGPRRRFPSVDRASVRARARKHTSPKALHLLLAFPGIRT